MQKKITILLAVLILMSMVLTACAPAAAPVVEAPAVVVAEPTAEPIVEAPAPDFQALFTELVAGLPADKGYGTVKVDVLNAELVEKAPFLLDVREAAELEKDGYIEGAINIPVRDLLKNLDKLPAMDQPIVIYCLSGHRGGLAMSALKLIGFTNVRNLAGGITAWQKASLPVINTPPAALVAGTPVIIENQGLYTALDTFLSELPDGFYTVKADKLNADLAEKAPVLVDIRTADEYNKTGYIAGAVNVPMQEIFANLDKLPAKDQPIVIYCVSGHRGAVTTMGLRLIGYTNVINLAGGINAWKAAQLPLAGVVDWNAVWGEYLSTLPEDMSTISAANLNTALVEAAPAIIDIREPAEYAEGHLAGAVNLPVRDLLNNLDKLPAQDQAIVIYCLSGHRGGLAMASLQLLGYKNVKNLAGGMNAWIKAELPVVTDAVEVTAGTAPSVDSLRLDGLKTFLAELPEGFLTIKPADLNGKLAEEPKPFLLDVRTAPELTADGAIEGVVNISITELWTRLAELPQDKATPMVVICKSGHRGAIAMMALRMNGYTGAINLAGGMNGWIAADLPVIK